MLKIANPAFTAVELAAQDAAAETIAEAEPTLRVAVPLPNLAGELSTAVTGSARRAPPTSGCCASCRAARWSTAGYLSPRSSPAWASSRAG